MKISKKEKILLVVLFLILASVVYYMFFYTKHTKELENLTGAMMDEENQYDLIQAKFISSSNLDNEISGKIKDIEKISADNYGLIRQENQTVLLKRLTRDTDFVIKSISYSSQLSSLADLDNETQAKIQEQMEFSLEDKLNSKNNGSNDDLEDNTSEVNNANNIQSDLSNSLVNVLIANINFEADYDEVDKFLKNVYEYKKNIIVSQLTFNSNTDSNQSGSLELAFYGIIELDNIIADAELNYFSKEYKRLDPKSAFQPYDSYVRINKVNASNSSWKSPFSDSDINDDFEISDDDIESGNENVSSGYSGSLKLLDSFSNLDEFFVGSSNSVIGNLSINENSKDNNKSLKLAFSFENPDLQNRAYIVFDKSKKMLYSPVSNISCLVYSESDLRENKIGAVLVNSKGDESVVYFDSTPRARKWSIISASLDSSLKYPLMIQRLFIEGEGAYQAVDGSIYFDNLRCGGAKQ